MAKIKKFPLKDSASRLSRKRVNKGRTVEIRRARNFKTIQFEGSN